MINTLTLNPAVDMIFFLDRINKNSTNRIKSKIKTVGGKGTHVSINLSYLGLKSRAYGLSYGKEGQYIIDQLNSYGIETRFFYAPDRESRTNYLLIEEDNTSTTIADIGITPAENEIMYLVKLMKEEINDGDFLVLAGDASNIVNPSIYNYICNELSDKDIRIILDSSGKAMENSLKLSPFLIKPNQLELAELCHMDINTEDDIIQAIKSLDIYDIDVIAVSLGKAGSIVKFRNNFYKTTPPTIKEINTAGCGDSFLAGLLFGIYTNLSEIETLRLATSISTAAATSALSIGFDLDLAKTLSKKAEVIELEVNQVIF